MEIERGERGWANLGGVGLLAHKSRQLCTNGVRGREIGQELKENG